MKKKIADRYEIIEKIGEGAYGKVYLAKDIKNNREVAVKKMNHSSLEEGVPISTLREISLLKEMNHVNVIKLLDIIHLENRIILVFEYARSDLKKKLAENGNKGFELKKAKSLLYQIIKGLAYIHKNKILHSDIKQGNILIDHNFNAKLTDFSVSSDYSKFNSLFFTKIRVCAHIRIHTY